MAEQHPGEPDPTEDVDSGDTDDDAAARDAVLRDAEDARKRAAAEMDQVREEAHRQA